MQHNHTVTEGRVRLIPLQESDIEKMRILRNHYRTCFVDSRPIQPEQQRNWFARYETKPNDYVFSVLLKSTGTWIGTVAIYDVQPEKCTAEFGRIMISKESVQEKGLGVDTTLAACRIAFEQLGLSEVHLEVFRDNLPAFYTYKKAGFQITGEQVLPDGRSMVNMSLERSKTEL